MKKPTMKQKKGKLIFEIATLIELEYDKAGGQFRNDLQKLTYKTLNYLIELLNQRKGQLT